jgi:hypothetical protein
MSPKRENRAVAPPEIMCPRNKKVEGLVVDNRLAGWIVHLANLRLGKQGMPGRQINTARQSGPRTSEGRVSYMQLRAAERSRSASFGGTLP